MIPGDDLVIDVTVSDGSATLRAAGEIDIGNVGRLQSELDALIRTVPGDVTIDMEAITFLDSSTLGALIGAKKRLQGSGRDLLLKNPRPMVVRILEITGLRGYLGVQAS